MVVYNFNKKTYWKVEVRYGYVEILLGLITPRAKGWSFRSTPLCAVGEEDTVSMESFRYIVGLMRRKAWERLKIEAKQARRQKSA